MNHMLNEGFSSAPKKKKADPADRAGAGRRGARIPRSATGYEAQAASLRPKDSLVCAQPGNDASVEVTNEEHQSLQQRIPAWQAQGQDLVGICRGADGKLVVKLTKPYDPNQATMGEQRGPIIPAVTPAERAAKVRKDLANAGNPGGAIPWIVDGARKGAGLPRASHDAVAAQSDVAARGFDVVKAVAPIAAGGAIKPGGKVVRGDQPVVDQVVLDGARPAQ